MKVSEQLQQGGKPLFSIEITPPERGGAVEDIFGLIEELLPYGLQFVNVTYHQPQVVYEEKNGIFLRRHIRKKPGTVGICAAIRSRFAVEPVMHLLCGGFSRYETEDALIDLHYLGVRNILALRGDPPPGCRVLLPEKDGHAFAGDLVAQIAALNEGCYQNDLTDAEPCDFCIGVAGFPEKHIESPNGERDLFFLKQKVDRGADYVMTQMFFDAGIYRNFVRKARETGITVPIIPGIKPLVSRKQMDLIPRTFSVMIPPTLVRIFDEARTAEQEFASGVDYTARMIERLLAEGAPGFHLFTAGRGRAAKALLERLNGSVRR